MKNKVKFLTRIVRLGSRLFGGKIYLAKALSYWFVFLLGLFALSFTQPVDTAWVRFYNGTGDSIDFATAMKIDNLGNVYVTGYSWDDITKEDFVTLKYSRTGNLLWTRRYNGTNENDRACAMALDGSGNIYVTGFSVIGTYTGLVTIKYLSNGDSAWIRRFDTTGYNCFPSAITVDNLNNVYITGMITGSSSYWDYLTVKYNSSGDRIWTRIYNGADNSYDSAAAIVADNLGNCYVTGYITQNGMEDYFTIKYNAIGETIWTRRYTRSGDSEDKALAMVLDNAGNLLVTGYSERGAGDFDFLTIKYSPAGDTLWLRRYHRPNGYDDIPTAIAVDNLNNVFVTGTSDQTSGTGNDYLTIKYDAFGNQQWTAYYNNDNNYDEPKAIFLDGIGNCYITGKSYNSTSYYDYATVKYNSNGTHQWTVRYNGSANGNDEPCAIALDDSGKIYVAGSVYRGFSYYDFGIVKYYELNDVGVNEIITPTNGETLDCYTGFQPEVSVVNYGGTNNPFTVRFEIYREGSLIYAQSLGLSLNPGETTEVVFQGILLTNPGNYTFRSYTVLAFDMNPTNDSQSGWFFVNPPTPQAWIKMREIPGGISSKPVKSGGSLVAVRGLFIYGLKGNNTNEFYEYFINGDSWSVRCSIPYAPEKRKRVKKGACLCYDSRDTMIYALKGNNTDEFWAYDPNLDTWLQKKSVPLGISGKRIKGGSGLAYRRVGDNRYIYCLKGSKTCEFWRYHINGDSWVPLPDAPLGISQKSFKDGSCLVRAGDYIYALKGNYNEFFAYRLADDSWITKKPLPLLGMANKRKKAKEGAALAYDANRRVIYALKGGNCNEFWAYFIDADTWIELPSMPLEPSFRKVKGGGALAFAQDNVFAFKGNKTLEFWRFTWDTTANIANNANISESYRYSSYPPGLAILGVNPNPVKDKVTVQYRMTSAGFVELKLYDVSGRCAHSSALGRKDTGTYHHNLAVKGLASGIYLLSLELSGIGPTKHHLVRKLIIMQ